MRIPLFDIDNTLLVGSNQAHREAFSVAIQSMYHLPEASVNDIVTDGKIDPQIILEICAVHGVANELVEPMLAETMQMMVNYVKVHAQNLTIQPAAGAAALLTELKQRQFNLGLLTGNIDDIAKMKLDLAGLLPYFDFGAFGNMGRKRVELVDIALQEVSRITNTLVSRDQLLIIGDTPLDIQCAVDAGIDSIGVATGKFSVEELRQTPANLVVPSLIDPEPIINFLLN